MNVLCITHNGQRKPKYKAGALVEEIDGEPGNHSDAISPSLTKPKRLQLRQSGTVVRNFSPFVRLEAKNVETSTVWSCCCRCHVPHLGYNRRR